MLHSHTLFLSPRLLWWRVLSSMKNLFLLLLWGGNTIILSRAALVPSSVVNRFTLLDRWYWFALNLEQPLGGSVFWWAYVQVVLLDQGWDRLLYISWESNTLWLVLEWMFETTWWWFNKVLSVSIFCYCFALSISAPWGGYLVLLRLFLLSRLYFQRMVFLLLREFLACLVLAAMIIYDMHIWGGVRTAPWTIEREPGSSSQDGVIQAVILPLSAREARIVIKLRGAWLPTHKLLIG